jgi:transcriptional regulator with XRE-family HTH domain
MKIDHSLEIRQFIRQNRKARGLSQGALGQQLGMMQRHISEIESGKVIPRLDTLIEMVRTLNAELVVVPKQILPLVQALIQDYQNPNHSTSANERSLYAVDDNEEESEE